MAHQSGSGKIGFFTIFLGLVAAGMLVIVRYYEIVKAHKDAESSGKTSSTVDKIPNGKPSAIPIPSPSNLPNTELPVQKQKNSSFNPRSAPKTLLDVGHGQIEITAKLIEESKVIISVIGRNYGDDLSPLQAWKRTSGDLFLKKLNELGVQKGSWQLTSNNKTFSVTNGVASLILEYEIK